MQGSIVVLKKILKKILPITWYIYISHVRKLLFLEKKVLQYMAGTTGRKKILLIGVPDYSNIGDQAIACAEKKFLIDNFSEFDIVELPLITYFLLAKKLACYKNDTIVCVQGGGNLGTLYFDVEYMLSLVLKYFNRQRVIVFPQTVYWEENSPNYKFLPQMIKRYEEHGDLYLFVRDRSIDFVENVMNRSKNFNTFNIPDIVLYLNKSEKKLLRDKILFCIRADKEKHICDKELEKIVNEVEKKGFSTSFTDTVYQTDILLQCREWVVENKLNEFRSAKLVITDRLHGMILAAITGTPCIALNNSTAKVQGVYDLWLNKLPYIKFANDINEIMKIFSEMDLKQEYSYSPEIFKEEWKLLADTIAEGIKID